MTPCPVCGVCVIEEARDAHLEVLHPTFRGTWDTSPFEMPRDLEVDMGR